MRRRPVALVIATCLLAACAPARAPGPGADATAAANPGAVPTPRRDGAWLRVHAAHLALSPRERATVQAVFLGDGLTRGWLEEGRGPWTQRLAGRGAVNFGIDGDRTEHLLHRIADGCLDGMRPETVVLLIGGENLLGNGPRQEPAQVAESVGAVVRAVRTRLPETRVLLLGLLPRHPGQAQEEDAIGATNTRLASLADGKRIRFLDLANRLRTADGAPDASLVTASGDHLTAAGYERLIEPLVAALTAVPGGG